MEKKKDKKTNFKLSEFMEYLSNNKNKEELKKLEILFDESNEQQRFCYYLKKFLLEDLEWVYQMV